MALDVLTGLAGQTAVPGRVLTPAGRASQAEWVDRLRDLYSYSPGRREQVVRGVYDVRKAAVEERMTKELSRLGLIPPDRRGRVAWRVAEGSDLDRRMRRAAEEQTDIILRTDAQFLDSWAERMKAEAPPMNRHGLNGALRRDLDERAQWKADDILETERDIASGAAVMDFYKETGICDPEADPFWHYVGPVKDTTCDRCHLVINATADGVTLDELQGLLDEANAMAPPVMHVHCPHDAEFRPPRGRVRRKENQEAARGWARLNGEMETLSTGRIYEVEPPETRPAFVKTRMPESASNALVHRVCGYKYAGKSLDGSPLPDVCSWSPHSLYKWAVAANLDEMKMPCSLMDDQAIGDVGEDVICALLDLNRTEKLAPFDGISAVYGVEIKTLRATTNQRAYVKRGARARKAAYAREHDVRPVTAYNVVDNETDELRVYLREGFGSFRIGTMQHVATVQRATGRVAWHAEALPWGEPLLAVAGGG